MTSNINDHTYFVIQRIHSGWYTSRSMKSRKNQSGLQLNSPQQAEIPPIITKLYSSTRITVSWIGEWCAHFSLRKLAKVNLTKHEVTLNSCLKLRITLYSGMKWRWSWPWRTAMHHSRVLNRWWYRQQHWYWVNEKQNTHSFFHSTQN